MSFNRPQLDPTPSALAQHQYRLLHDIYIQLDAADRAVLSQFDLTPSQYTLLALLNRDEGQRLITLADRLLVARSTVTRLIDQMEQRGLVQRVDDPEDRRAQRVILTLVGDNLLRQALAAHQESLSQRFDQLDETEQNHIVTILTTMRDSLQVYVDRVKNPA
ncbi:MAG TPA: MarR family transcriptional regulator [Phototrophicaceae bacterium]|nr:MarR family transcriptional regulator [Phototrophicaceae bacterium]